MGLFGSSDPVKVEEKALAREAKHDVKEETAAEKELARIKKQAAAAAKDHHKAVAHHDKAITNEHKLADKANAAAHKHNEAVSLEQKLLNDIKANETHHAQLEQEIAAREKALKQVTHKHHVNDRARESKLHSLETAKTPGATTGTTGTGSGLAANDPTYTGNATTGARQ